MKKLSVFSLLVILLLILAACGGDEAGSAESDTPVETEIATPVPPTPEPDTEEETPVEAPTAEPTPTETAIVEVVEEETEPAGGDVASSGDGWGASGSDAQTACDHPFMPMRTGSTWSYSDGENTLIWEVTDVQGDLESATAQMQVTISDVTIDYTWDCMAGEGMASFDFANLGIGPGGVELSLEQQSADGVFLLPADQLSPGESWVMTTESTFTFMQSEADTEIEVSGDMTNEQNQIVISANPVTFEGQTVDGVQIEQVNTITMAMDVLGNAVEQVINTSGTYDLGRGIGMVSQSYSTDFGTTDRLDLVSYFVP